ncbi:hypothetical protein E1218_21425 [Kribbella turkmenica]|uniref:Uncharacterized protein n=1 Tax=Kribbella turkmenica TaxID=2530375 RepID=A0A4R4WU26_9ACTN|nr:hypothetical protein [Kribbella turkmenica]TDD21124.1 hypothetical protein E1218_21425 [Kribbella turkmenica]
MTDQHGDNSGDDRPAPYPGVFGAPGGGSAQPPGSHSSAQPPGSHPSGSYGDRQNPYAPGAYSGAFGANLYADAPPPKQVTVAAVISFGLGALCLLLAGLALTSAGEQIAEIVTGSKDAQGTVVAVVLACAAAYIVPAVYLRKRRAWARYVIVGVAAVGIAGGLMSLPNSILGLAIHGTLLFLMLQQPTKLWFHHR